MEAISEGLKLIAAELRNVIIIPPEKRLWAAEQIAEYFGSSSTTIYRTVLCKPDFPKAIKIAGGAQRWVAGEVMEWAESQRGERRNGRPRKAA